MRTLLFTSVLILGGLGSQPAYADSDGYYCVGPGYLSVEFRSFNTPGLSGSHVLRIIRFGGERGIYEAGEVVIEDFQPHVMTCGANRVQISGYDREPVTYTIDVRDTPRVLHYARLPGQQLDSPPQPLKNLGQWASPGTIRLPSSDAQHTYQLVMTAEPPEGQQPEGGILHRSRTELQQLDREGRLVARLVLYEDEWFESID